MFSLTRQHVFSTEAPIETGRRVPGALQVAMYCASNVTYHMYVSKQSIFAPVACNENVDVVEVMLR